MDTTEQAGNSERRVGHREHQGRELRTVTITRSYPTDIDDLWDACTNPERIPRWFLPVSGELHVGGRYSLEGNASGTIEECEPPRRFFLTWEARGDVTWLEVRLTAEDAAHTRLELEHIADVDDATWAQFGPGAVGIGWDMALWAFAKHLESGGAVDPVAAQEWMTSDDGRRFVSSSSEAWRDANIAAGTPAADADTAAAHVIAAYRGEPAG